MLPILLLNAANALIVTGCVIRGWMISDPKYNVFRYFTTLSNMLCAAASVVLVVFAAIGRIPEWAVLLKYVGTVAVTVTMLTVFLLLGPVSHDWKGLLTGLELFLHLICPVLALVSYIVFEKTDMPAWIIALGTAPVLLYGALYLKKVIYSQEGREWKDFYGFNANGRWPLSFALMLLGAAAVSFLLWLV